MRLIDADALKGVMIETLERIKANPKMDTHEMHIIAAFHAVGEMVDDAPTVNSVAVVRCKDCKYYGEEGGSVMDGRYKMCSIYRVWHTGSWYCAIGERKSNEVD